ncbi:hypothetical protein [Tardiphaga robiniae]|uniref:Uncharacterized protein n=1 Tax=Tardiphaga robiniae TaxID=943830 RepID=A0A7G6U2C3_9BRAD|nr:hypothetical protein [Tardiphaga robiniae]QND73155.1 hypothetical protein HB776_19545 [Tardiphaga robiniae]
MDRRSELFDRVKGSAAALAYLVSNGTNIPLHEYVDKTSLTSLCDSLGLEPEAWQADDLERILVIRDGLYDLRDKLRDTDENAEHSVEQILSGTDRLYADLERAFRELKQDELAAAQAQIAALHRGPHIAAAALPQTASEMSKTAGEVMTQAHTSLRHVDLNLMKVDRSNPEFEVLKSVKLSIQRLSASAFAIKLSAEQTVIYQGIFKLLSDGADRVLDDLKSLIQKMKTGYEKASSFISELSQLAEQGTRFSRLVADFLNKAFLDLDRKEEVFVELKVQGALSGEALLCATMEGCTALVISKNGNAWTGVSKTGSFKPRFRVHGRAVFAARAYKGDDGNGFIAIGTDDGLQISSDNSVQSHHRSFVRERVVSVVAPPWGKVGSRGTIVSGSRDGIVRRWTLAENRLQQMNDQSYESVGKRLQCMIVVGSNVVAASQTELVTLDHSMKTVRSMRVPFEVASMDVVGDETLIACGEGHLTQIRLAAGSYSQILTASNRANYSCVASRDDDSFYYGTSDGRVGVMQLSSGVELGSVDVGFPLNGLLEIDGKLLAYGGEWSPKPGRAAGRSAVWILVETKIQPVKGEAVNG